jgi:hypothetical protein
VVIVTNQFHGYRSLKVFQQAAREAFGPSRAVTVDICEVPASSDSATLQIDFFREWLAIGLYKMKGWM